MSTVRNGPYSSTCPTCIEAQSEIQRLKRDLEKALNNASDATKRRLEDASSDVDRAAVRVVSSIIFALGLLLLSSGILLFILSPSYKTYVGGVIRIAFTYYDPDNVWLFASGLALVTLGSLGINWTRIKAWAGL